MEKEIDSHSTFCSTVDLDNINAAVVLESIKNSMGEKLSNQMDPVIQLASELPAYSGSMLEFHFDRDDVWFDFAFRINKDFDKPLLSKNLLLNNASSFILEGYQQLVDQMKTGFLFGVENVCFEYDFPFQADPSLFFDMHRDRSFSPKRTSKDLFHVTGLFNYFFYPELYNFLLKIEKNNLKVVYYGLMFSRNLGSIRLTINGIEPYRLVETLKALGWSGNDRLLHDFQRNYLNADQRIVAAINFDTCLSNKIGIEVFSRNNDILMKKLYENGIFEGKQYDFLKKWPGTISLQADVSLALTELHQRTITDIYRRINHFKFTIENNRVKTKAYLYYCF